MKLNIEIVISHTNRQAPDIDNQLNVKVQSRNNRLTGFTIVELLIVIVVIGILAAISIVAYNGIQTRATDSITKTDISNATKQLGVESATEGVYPTGTGGDLSSLERAEGTTYQYTSDGSSYMLSASSSRSNTKSYCVTSESTSPREGVCEGHVANAGGSEGGGGSIALTCEDGFIPVPGNTSLGTSDFCVMKYEAKNVGGVAISQTSGSPWVNINQDNARTAAENACDDCRLITEPEWMTLAANVLSVPSNWTSGTVGTGSLYRGHSDNSPASALVASSSDSDGYSGTGNSSPSEQRRTLTLTNGEVIWDLAGNVREWTDATITGAQPDDGTIPITHIDFELSMS